MIITARKTNSTAVTLIVLAIGSALAAGTAAKGSATESRSDVVVPVPVVEYVKVDGKPCLQPKILSGSPGDTDLVAAQKRWLAKNFPGYRLVRQQHILTLAPEFRPAGQEKDPPTDYDWMEFETAGGKPIPVCFSRTLSTPTSASTSR